jgi:hypothetical protein
MGLFISTIVDYQLVQILGKFVAAHLSLLFILSEVLEIKYTLPFGLEFSCQSCNQPRTMKLKFQCIYPIVQCDLETRERRLPWAMPEAKSFLNSTHSTNTQSWDLRQVATSSSIHSLETDEGAMSITGRW